MNRCRAIENCYLPVLLWLGASAATAAETWQLESTAGGAIPAPNTGNEQTACLVGDLDGDGRLDVVGKPYTVGAPGLNVWLQRVDGSSDVAASVAPAELLDPCRRIRSTPASPSP